MLTKKIIFSVFIGIFISIIYTIPTSAQDDIKPIETTFKMIQDQNKMLKF
jgi:hypothetical protein